MTTPENWQPVVEDDRYLVSDQGQVFSTRSNRVLIASTETHGRLRVDLGKGRTRLVHRLMLEAFVGPAPEGKPFALHWDDNPINNRLENLRWGSPSENNLDAVRNGRHPNARKTHCKRGHEYTPENTYLTKPGTRMCLECKRMHNRNRSKVSA